MQPLDLKEWAQSFLTSPGNISDYAREVLDLIENNMTDEWAELVEDLEFAVGHRARGSNLVVPGFTHDQARKALEGLCDKANSLDEIAEKLFPVPEPTGRVKVLTGDACLDKINEILDKLERVSGILDWVECSPKPTPEEYADAFADLRKLFPLPEPKKPEPPKLEFDL